ncbi:hypothetical protein LCGC14_1491810 [marine sediment metagenome]|uniref:Uncharacterized protein n=1 Tax=marine sediment metagenome TaxID=412755 RepID=A0A0F9JSG4_9ZZZZ
MAEVLTNETAEEERVMDSNELNERIRALEDDDQYTVKGIEGTGKCIPYYGWFWRDVDFDGPLNLGWAGRDGFDTPDFVGFMENNKWGYDYINASQEEGTEIRRLLELAVVSPRNETLQTVFDYMQTLKPGGKP